MHPRGLLKWYGLQHTNDAVFASPTKDKPIFGAEGQKEVKYVTIHILALILGLSYYTVPMSWHPQSGFFGRLFKGIMASMLAG